MLNSTFDTLRPILFNDTVINETNEIKSLWLTITQNLSWDSHIYNCISKASKRLFVLRSYRNLLPRQALTTIYTSLIRPVIEFGDVIYDSGTLSIGHQIEQFQRQAAIICSGAYRHTKYESLLNELGWESLSSRRRQHKLVLFYKILKKIYPSYLYNFIHFKHIGQYNLRRPQEIVPRFTRLSLTTRSYFPSTTRDWNKLPTSVQNSLSIVTFKSLLKIHQFKSLLQTLHWSQRYLVVQTPYGAESP